MNLGKLLKALAALPRQLLLILIYFLTLKWLFELIALIRKNRDVGRRGEFLRDIRRGQLARCSPRCAVIRPEVYKRADPLIYSQFYLMEQGLAVTWDNPDIQLYDGGMPVSSSALTADKDYDVVATIYNNSTDAPAVGLPVQFFYRTFGVGAAIIPIGTTKINLPVKGAPSHPTPAKVTWHTPATPGHYCLLVNLVWPDDANPKNNLGQENTNVGKASSPATFRFPVRNEDTIEKRIHMTADAYVIPNRLKCNERPTKGDSDRRYAKMRRNDVFVPPLEEAADWTLARARHGADRFPIPADWNVVIEPADFTLAPGADQNVKVTITPPATFQGARAFNINAMYGAGLLGGVTLTVTK